MVKIPVNIPCCYPVMLQHRARGSRCFFATYAQGMMLEAPSEAGLKISEFHCMSALPDIGEDLAKTHQPWTYFLSDLILFYFLSLRFVLMIPPSTSN